MAVEAYAHKGVHGARPILASCFLLTLSYPVRRQQWLAAIFLWEPQMLILTELRKHFRTLTLCASNVHKLIGCLS